LLKFNPRCAMPGFRHGSGYRAIVPKRRIARRALFRLSHTSAHPAPSGFDAPRRKQRNGRTLAVGASTSDARDVF
jgi:hypothetical protein